MKKLIDISDLEKDDIYEIWQKVSRQSFTKINGDVAWSFEGVGIRTRTTFVQAFQSLGLSYVELPDFLKTSESVEDLAGYMDPFFSIYVIRESNHERLAEFAKASKKPLINAMSCEAHPCEVLTDAYFLHSKHSTIQELNILLWGPTTNVYRSWYSLSRVIDLNITHYCPEQYHSTETGVAYIDKPIGNYDVVITDGWPSGFSDSNYSLSEQGLLELGNPMLLPTPPVTVGNELLFNPSRIDLFSGYEQKALLLPVQRAIVQHLLNEG